MPAPRKPKKVFIQFAVALIVAIIFGLIAIFVAFTVVQGVSGNAAKIQKEAEDKAAAAKAEQDKYQQMLKTLNDKPKSYTIVQALVDLKPGQPITQGMVGTKEVEELPTPGTLKMVSQALGKVVKAPIMKSEPLESGKLLDTGSFVQVDPGKRAITIQVDSIGGLSGALTPGAHVDVLTTVAQDDSVLTRTLLQNVPVVSVSTGGSSGGGGNSKSGAMAGGAKSGSGANLAVTLIVQPKDAEMLALAGQLGGFHLTLRNFTDNKQNSLVGADVTSLMTGMGPSSLAPGLPQPKTPSADKTGFQNVNYSPEDNLPAPSGTVSNGPKFTMQIYRGTGAETVDFQH